MLPALFVTGSLAEEAPLVLSEFKPSDDAWCEIRERWIDRLIAENPEGGWVPWTWEPTDEDLALLGLPSRDVLANMRFPEPTMVSPDGSTEVVSLEELRLEMEMSHGGPTPTTYAGSGCMGIRPGAFLLLLTGGSVGWCSMAHVYGAPGSYQISTAGHCGKVGDIATVIAAVGNRNAVTRPILLDFGKFAKSTGDAGIGKDWALIGVDAEFQSLVSPTMCFWGGPIGMYTKTGATVAASLITRNGRIQPSVTTNPDPLLIQGVVHYGHGTGVGTGGTPRTGTTFYWTTGAMIWEGAISPGDSGSGSNTAGGDTIGAEREAAAINTHIFVDATLKTGIGYLAGTRATLVTATLANGQLVPYPIQAPGLP